MSVLELLRREGVFSATVDGVFVELRGLDEECGRLVVRVGNVLETSALFSEEHGATLVGPHLVGVALFTRIQRWLWDVLEGPAGCRPYRVEAWRIGSDDDLVASGGIQLTVSAVDEDGALQAAAVALFGENALFARGQVCFWEGNGEHAGVLKPLNPSYAMSVLCAAHNGSQRRPAGIPAQRPNPTS